VSSSTDPGILVVVGDGSGPWLISCWDPIVVGTSDSLVGGIIFGSGTFLTAGIASSSDPALSAGLVLAGSDPLVGSLTLIGQAAAANFTASGVAGAAPAGEMIVLSGAGLATPH
jgi:hypothetical protein